MQKIILATPTPRGSKLYFVLFKKSFGLLLVCFVISFFSWNGNISTFVDGNVRFFLCALSKRRLSNCLKCLREDLRDYIVQGDHVWKVSCRQGGSTGPRNVNVVQYNPDHCQQSVSAFHFQLVIHSQSASGTLYSKYVGLLFHRWIICHRSGSEHTTFMHYHTWRINNFWSVGRFKKK